MSGKIMTIDDLADELLHRLAERGFAHLSFLYDEVDDTETSHRDYEIIKDAFLREGLISPKSQTETYSITDKGKSVVDNGGYSKYIKDKRKEEAKEISHKRRERTMTKWKLWLFWPLFSIALIGAVGNAEATWNLFLKLFKGAPATEKTEKVKESQELKASTLTPQPETDSLRNE